MAQYELAPGLIFILNKKYACKCGEDEFQVPVDKSNGVSYVCSCGEVYNEARINDIMFAMMAEEAASGQQGN